uniref:Uncharacterized protein n=1 Tax=Knipowitschia caucasica TaxID=637954 RepID=A0AAV2L893_KNICA
MEGDGRRRECELKSAENVKPRAQQETRRGDVSQQMSSIKHTQGQLPPGAGSVFFQTGGDEECVAIAHAPCLCLFIAVYSPQPTATASQLLLQV